MTFLLKTPRHLINVSNFAFGRALVNMFAIWSSYLWCFNFNLFSASAFLRKWYWILICLVLSWNTRFLPIAIADWLSQKISIETFWFCHKSIKIFLNQITSFTAAAAVTLLQLLIKPKFLDIFAWQKLTTNIPPWYFC